MFVVWGVVRGSNNGRTDGTDLESGSTKSATMTLATKMQAR